MQNWFQERIQEFPNILKDLEGVCPSTKAPKTKEKPKGASLLLVSLILSLVLLKLVKAFSN